MCIGDVRWQSQMLHCSEEGNGIFEGYFPLADGCLRASGYFCTLGRTSYIFNVVETASALDLDTPGFKCHSVALGLGTSYYPL